MKTISRILLILLGLIVAVCIFIMICAANPSLSSKLSAFTRVSTKNDAQQENSTSEITHIDIESMLEQIENQSQQDDSNEEEIIDLGLIDTAIFTSLDDYYSKLVDIIKNNYAHGMTISFSLLISEEIFPEWYEVNYKNRSVGGSSNAFSFDVSYMQQDNDSYLISHIITLE